MIKLPLKLKIALPLIGVCVVIGSVITFAIINSQQTPNLPTKESSQNTSDEDSSETETNKDPSKSAAKPKKNTPTKSSGTSKPSSSGGGSSGGSDNSSGGSTGGQAPSGGGSSTSCALPNYPDASCTGVPAGTTLTQYTGPSSLTAGTIIDSKIVNACLSINQPGVIIRNSRITTSCFYGIDSWITTSDQSTWTQVINSEVICTNAGSGIGERGIIVRGVEISGCENGMDLDQDGIVEDSYIHSLDEGPTGEGHGDGIQSAILTNVVIRHNTIIGRSGNLITPGSNATSAIITPPNGTQDVLIENNFLAGGAYTIYCPENSPVNVRVLNNTFASMSGSLGAEYGYTDGCDLGTVFSGNVTDTGQAVNP